MAKRYKAMKLVMFSIFFILLAVLLLGVKVFFVKGGRFPSGHVHDIPALRSRGIGCASADRSNSEKS